MEKEQLYSAVVAQLKEFWNEFIAYDPAHAFYCDNRFADHEHQENVEIENQEKILEIVHECLDIITRGLFNSSYLESTLQEIANRRDSEGEVVDIAARIMLTFLFDTKAVLLHFGIRWNRDVLWSDYLHEKITMVYLNDLLNVFKQHEPIIRKARGEPYQSRKLSDIKKLYYETHTIELTNPPQFVYLDDNKLPYLDNEYRKSSPHNKAKEQKKSPSNNKEKTEESVQNYATSVTPSFYVGFSKTTFGKYLVIGLQIAIAVLVVLSSPLSPAWIGLAAGLALGGGIGLATLTKQPLSSSEEDRLRATNQGIPRSLVSGILVWSWLLFLLIHQLIWVCV
jgi:hypothetical protein